MGQGTEDKAQSPGGEDDRVMLLKVALQISPHSRAGLEIGTAMECLETRRNSQVGFSVCAL